jgi:hypothetical protein
MIWHVKLVGKRVTQYTRIRYGSGDGFLFGETHIKLLITHKTSHKTLFYSLLLPIMRGPLGRGFGPGVGVRRGAGGKECVEMPCRDAHRVIGTAAFSKVVIPDAKYPAEDYLSHTPCGLWRRSTSRFRVRHSIDISIDIAEFTAEPVEGYCLPLTAQHHTARTDLSDRETPREREKYQRSIIRLPS